MHALYTDILFWLFFLGINTAIFLPSFVLHYPLSSFFPDLYSEGDHKKISIQKFFSRPNQDIFRISADLAIISIVGYLCKSIPFFYILSLPIGIYLMFVIIYQITNAVFKKIYHKTFTNLELLQYLITGRKIIQHTAFYQVVMIFATILLLLGGAVLMAYKYLLLIGSHGLSPTSIVLLLIFSIIPFYIRKKLVTMFFTNKVFPLHFPEIFNLLFKTNYVGYQKLLQIDFDQLLVQQPATHYRFHSKPNVYVIVIESYGKIVLDEKHHPDNNYENRIAWEEKLFKEAGLQSVSSLAASPIAGGGSWIAYSSFLFGINMDNQLLFEKYFSSEKMHDYNHLFRFLKKNGYKNYRVNAVGKGFDGITVPWDAYSKFYAVDEWIHFKDMQYEGQMYGFGPAPPDQFILHKSVEKIKDENCHPYSYFLLTQNSHSPFTSLPSFEENWKNCNVSPQKKDEKSANFIAIPKLDHYFKAIDYELQTVFQFIRDQEGDNVFIVFGDHQPPMFDKAKMSTLTPVHIISKNQQFLDAYKKEGFSKGLMPSSGDAVFNFEGMLSLFIKAFVAAFSNETNTPTYLPSGNKMKNEQQK